MNLPPGLQTSPVAEIRSGTVDIGGRILWRDVELTLAEGEFTALLGPNGAGKSTLVKVLLGLVPLSAGTATVLGRPARRGDRRIGYLPQRRSFGAQLRIRGRDVVRLGLDGDRWGLPLPGASRWSASARQAGERVGEVIALVGATEYADRPIGELSGGEQQRLLIAQALAARPKLLLLDEPLDSLDLPNQVAVADLVAGICRRERVAVLMVAHDVNPILAHLDQVAGMAHGSLVAGRPRDLVTTERLSGLFGTPVEVLTTSDGRTIVVGGPGGHGAHPEPAVRWSDSASGGTW